MTTVNGLWLTRPATQRVLRLLTEQGYGAYAVGGCVRDALLETKVGDVDIATDALPESVTYLAEKAGLKVVPTGVDHGTVTVVSEGTGYEVTTFRADVETFGRHAVVRFSKDIKEDARRRDFTMNALYSDAGGQVIDPLGGLQDLRARRVRFIEDAARRIEEDYLRTLRFYRFSAWYGDPAQGFDPEALSAIATHLDGLATLSRERVGAEIRKLLSAPDPAPAVASMQQTGVLARCLPGADPTALAPLIHLEEVYGFEPDPLRRMASLGMFDGAALRYSRHDIRRLAQYRNLIGSSETADALGYRHGASMAHDVLLLRNAMLQMPLDPDDMRRASSAASQNFPVAAKDLMPGLKGPELGRRLTELEDRWIASGFTLTRAQLLSL